MESSSARAVVLKILTQVGTTYFAVLSTLGLNAFLFKTPKVCTPQSSVVHLLAIRSYLTYSELILSDAAARIPNNSLPGLA